MVKRDELEDLSGTVVRLSDRLRPNRNDRVGQAISNFAPELDALLRQLCDLQKCVEELENGAPLSEGDQLVLILLTYRISAAVGEFSDALVRAQ